MSHHISDIFSAATGKGRLLVDLMWKEITTNFNQYFCKYFQPGRETHIKIHARVVYAIMLVLGIPKTTLHVTLKSWHAPWQTLVGLAAAPSLTWCRSSVLLVQAHSTPLLAQTRPRSFSHLYYMIPQKIRNVCSQILLFPPMFSHMPQKKVRWKYIWGPKYVRVLQ